MEEVHKADPYDVVAYNLTELHEAIARFRTLTSANFIVRMDPHEADIYGGDVLALLERAHSTITQKYGLPLKERTIVEIFPGPEGFRDPHLRAAGRRRLFGSMLRARDHRQ